MEVFIYILATFRITILLIQERGPWDVFGRLRDLAGIRYDDMGQPYAVNELARGLVCTWCLSVWVALGWLVVKVLLPDDALYLAFAFAISGGALIVHEVLEWLEQTRRRS